MMRLKESQIMKMHYMTAIGALFTVAVHIMFRVIMPFGKSISFQNIIMNYHNIPYVVLLESILVLVSIHGFNGLRVILLELRQNRKWENAVTIFTIVAMVSIVVFGTRTIIIANGFAIR
jgi:succinate dehydrogenase / fumarate reductase, membrane anchor subunit